MNNGSSEMNGIEYEEVETVQKVEVPLFQRRKIDHSLEGLERRQI
jgi:hypothetical protein